MWRPALAGPTTDDTRPQRRHTLKGPDTGLAPGCQHHVCCWRRAADVGAVGGLRKGLERRLLWRCRHVLHARPQPGRRSRLRISTRRPGAGVEGIRVRSRGTVPEAGPRRPAVLREGLHLSTGGGALHLAVRHERLPGAARDPDDAVLPVRLFVLVCAQSSGERTSVRVCVPVRLAGAHLPGAGRARLLHLCDRSDRVLLLVLQGSGSADFGDAAGHVADPLVARSAVGRGCGGAVGGWHLCQAHQCPADRAAAGVGADAQPVASHGEDRRDLWFRGGGVVRAQHGGHRRVELPGRREKNVLQRRRRRFQGWLPVPG